MEIFGTVFGQSGPNFRECFWTVRTEFLELFRTVWTKFSGLFSGSPDRIFGQSGTDFRTVCVVFFICYCKNLNNMLVVLKSC